MSASYQDGADTGRTKQRATRKPHPSYTGAADPGVPRTRPVKSIGRFSARLYDPVTGRKIKR